MRPHVIHWLEGLLPAGIASALAPTWFTCVGLAGVVTLLAMLAIARRHRLDTGAVSNIVLWCYVAAVAAGIVVPSAIDAAEQLCTTGRAHIRWAGMTSFWGYLAGGCAVAAVCRAHDLPLRRFADLAAAPLGIALMLARLGCFLAGCDYGKVSSLPWALRFPAHSPAWQDHIQAGLLPVDRAESLPVHPTQLYEAALGLAITVVAGAAARGRWARHGSGRVFLIAAVIYATGRIAIEDLRGDGGRGIYLGLSSGQIFSWLVLAAIGAARCLRWFRPATAPAAGAVVLVLALAEPGTAHAQPAPAPPATAPQPPDPALPSPAPPRPAEPFGPPPRPPSSPPAPASVRAGSPATSEPERPAILQVGLLVGAAAPFNRRRDQVASLAGASLSIGLGFRELGLWLDLDSFGNRDASHGTVLVSGSLTAWVSRRVRIGGRVGFGATLVNFDDPAFRDVAGITGRFEALIDVRLGDAWSLWLRPLSLDAVSAADLGGPIATVQARIGLAYRFGLGRPSPSPPAVAASSPRSR